MPALKCRIPSSNSDAYGRRYAHRRRYFESGDRGAGPGFPRKPDKPFCRTFVDNGARRDPFKSG